MVERAIAPGQVPTNPIRCPKCRGRNLVLEGSICRGFVEHSNNGKVIKQELADELERETYSIECKECEIRWFIMTHEEHALFVENLQLEQHLFELLPELSRAGYKFPS